MGANIIFVISIYLTSILWQVTASCKGCVELDSLTFDKILSNFDYSVVKFDISYPYGEKHEQYEEFSKAAADVSNLLVAVVGVKDYGDKDNEDLAVRFNVKTEKLPVIKLFHKNNLEQPIEFTGKCIRHATLILMFIDLFPNYRQRMDC